MRKILIWFLLLNKRLYKKVTYVGILLLIPIFVLIFNASAQEPSGVVTVVLGREDPHDPVALEIVEQLKEETLVIAFYEDTPEAALEQVEAGKADAAWIFPGGLQNKLKAFANEEKDSGGFIRVVEREQTVALRLAREKLGSVVYARVAEEIYLNYVRDHVPEIGEKSDQELLAYMDRTDVSGELFAFYDIYGNLREESGNYLTAPLRGMLAVLAAISAIVTAMYYQKDEERGIFSLLSHQYRFLGELGYQLISAINILGFVLIALIFAGLSVKLWQELLLFVMYSLCCALFGMTVRIVFGGGRMLAVQIPVLTLVMLVVCPVFFDLSSIRYLQFFFPPTYYISGAYNYSYLLYMVLYCGALALICVGGTFVKKAFSGWRKHLPMAKI